MMRPKKNDISPVAGRPALISLADACYFWHNSFGMHPGKPRKSHCAIFQCLVLLLGSVLVQAQQPDSKVTFEQSFPGSEPGHYIISITSDCHATYQSNGKLTEEAAADEAFHFDFTVTQPSCANIFDLTKRAHYFEGKVDSKKKNLAQTGIKTLSYKDPQKSTKGTYNYSPISEVQELTSIFQAFGATLEFGRRLDYDQHYQKLALDDELKRMEELSGNNGLQEISAISQTLRNIVDDPSLMNVVRVRAQRLLVGVK